MKNKLYKLFTLSLVLGAGVFNASAQLNCGTTQATQKLFQEHPELSAAFDDYNANLTQIIQNKTQAQRSNPQVYIIPIVFHIIHQNGTENISDAQILSEVSILNRDYRKLNSDTSSIIPPFVGLASDCYIEFRLAQLDPNGNCTNGIDRIYSHKTNGADDASKLNPWPRDKYLNVWVVKTIGSAGVAGYAYYPSAVAGPLFPYDGVLILSDYIGSVGTGSVFTSRALTHEIGHYLNLQHPWGNNNDPNVACGDDLVNDTPPTKGHTACTAADLYNPACTTYPINVNYKFDSVTTSSGTTDPTPVTAVTGLTVSPMTANGAGANSTVAGKFSYDNWDTGATDGATTYASMTGAINTNKYYEFTVSPATNAYSMTLTAITFFMDRNATGPRTWAVRSSANNFASNLPASVSPANTNLSPQSTGTVLFLNSDITTQQKGSKFTLSGASFVNRLTPVTFRIYPYNAEDAAGTFGIDSVYLAGTNGLIENTQNYMDYSYCSKMYTIDQKDRMRAALESPIASRNNLWSQSNLDATGVSSPQICKPYPDFFANKNRVCAGNTVKFTKNILYGAADSVRWTFYGGTPATSTSSAASVNVVYPNAGYYKVTLTAYNAAGTDSVVKSDYIRVDQTWSDINGFHTEGFQNDGDYYGKWQVTNYDNNNATWGINTNTGYMSSRSIYMKAFGNYQYDVDDLVSPSYNLSFTSGDTMTFRCAAASHAGNGLDVNDMLKVYSSTDCGNTWIVRATFKDSTLINDGYSAGAFVPTSPTQWALRKVPLPAGLSSGNVRFKFEYTTGSESNNIYIDDINISGVVGIDEATTATSSLSIYPNPTSQSSTIAYHLDKKAATKIEVVDVIGKKIFVQSNSGQAEGDYSVVISKESLNLKNGIYFVRFSVDDQSVTKKLIVTQ